MLDGSPTGEPGSAGSDVAASTASSAEANARFELAAVLAVVQSIVAGSLLISAHASAGEVAIWYLTTWTVAIVATNLALTRAQVFANLIRTAFDLHRNDLLKKLGLDPPTTPNEEKKVWIAVENALYRNDFTGIAAYSGGSKGSDAEQPAPTPWRRRVAQFLGLCEPPAAPPPAEADHTEPIPPAPLLDPPWGTGETFPLSRVAFVVAIAVGGLLVGGASISSEVAEEPPRPTASKALVAGHRIELSDLTIVNGCKIEGLDECDDLETRVTVEPIAAGAAVDKKNTIPLPESRTIVPIALGDRATLAEPFAAGDDVRVMLSPLPSTTADPDTVDAVMVAQQKDPDRVLVAFTADDLDKYRNLAGRSQVDVIAATD